MIIDVDQAPEAWGQFLELPGRIAEGERGVCPVGPEKEAASVGRPKFAGRQRVLIVRDDARCVARVVARCSPTLSDASGRPYGTLGFFAAFDEPEAVAALLAEGVRWLRERGAGEIVGPMDGDTWHHHRFNLGPHEHPPFLMEPVNPPFYPALWEACGFEPIEGYFSKHVEDVVPARDALAPRVAKLPELGYTLRPMDLDRFRDELETFYGLSSEIFADNFLYDHIPFEDFLQLYQGIRPLLDPQLVWFAHAADGTAVGFVFAYTDHVPGQDRAETVNIKSLGVLETHRRWGLGAALMGRVYQALLEMGLRRANLCLVRDGNPSGGLEGGAGWIFRRYALYRYAGAD